MASRSNGRGSCGVDIVFTYDQTQRQAQRRAELQAANDTKLRAREIAKPFFDKQFAVYLEMTQIAGRLATSENSNTDVSQGERRLQELQNGELAVVGDMTVTNATTNLIEHLQEAHRQNTNESRQQVSRDLRSLTGAIQRDLFDSYRILSVSQPAK